MLNRPLRRRVLTPIRQVAAAELGVAFLGENPAPQNWLGMAPIVGRAILRRMEILHSATVAYFADAVFQRRRSTRAIASSAIATTSRPAAMYFSTVPSC